MEECIMILETAAAIAAALGVAHSCLGERRLIGPLVAPERRTGKLAASGAARRTLRFAWHLTSVAWLGSAAILWVVARNPPDAVGARVLEVLAVVYAVTAAIVFGSSRGRHFAWPPLVFIALAAWHGAMG
jgi:hypothetical protein